MSRNGADVRLVAVADTRSHTGRSVRLQLDRVQLLTADALPFSLDDLTNEEGVRVERGLEDDLAHHLAAVAALPPRIRRIAETTGLSAPQARALALDIS